MLENFDDFLKEMKQTNSEFKDYDEGYFKFKLETISGLLKSERIKKNMTQKELAIKINTHPQVISRIENNPMNLSLLTFFKLANALGKKVVLDLVEKEALPKR